MVGCPALLPQKKPSSPSLLQNTRVHCRCISHRAGQVDSAISEGRLGKTASLPKVRRLDRSGNPKRKHGDAGQEKQYMRVEETESILYIQLCMVVTWLRPALGWCLLSMDLNR